eukprot:Gb_34674 [translate_table: standard]
MEEELKEVKGGGSGSGGLPSIFSTPKQLLDLNREAFVPRVISLGPYHFGNPELQDMEKHKSEAARRMQSRLQGRGISFNTVVDNIKAMEQRIRHCYDKEISYSAGVLSWIMARDACFILEFLVNYIKRFLNPAFLDNNTISRQYDPVFDLVSENPVLNSILEDIFQLENQIPLFILIEIIAMEMPRTNESPEKRLRDIVEAYYTQGKFIPFPVFVHFPDKLLSVENLLELLHHRNAGVEYLSNQETFPEKPDVKCKCLCLSLSISFHLTKPFLEFISSCCTKYLRAMKKAVTANAEVESRPKALIKLPSAMELNNAGVKFQALHAKDMPQGAAVDFIKFDEKTCTLYLPQIEMVTTTDRILRNMIALEACSPKYRQRKLSRYFKLMDELIDSEQDVTLLRKHEIISNYLGSDKQAAQAFNSLATPIYKSVGFPPIDRVRGGLEKYYERKYRILWSEFWEAYFSKPWLVAGSLGATLLLLFTFAQVVCLFYTCNPRSH